MNMSPGTVQAGKRCVTTTTDRGLSPEYLTSNALHVNRSLEVHMQDSREKAPSALVRVCIRALMDTSELQKLMCNLTMRPKYLHASICRSKTDVPDSGFDVHKASGCFFLCKRFQGTKYLLKNLRRPCISTNPLRESIWKQD